MKQFEIKQILIPVDFSETSLLALEHATFMAKLFKADITLLHVLQQNDYHFSIPEQEFAIPDISFFTEIIEKQLQELSEKIKKQYGINVKTLSSVGRVFRQIIHVAKEKNIDLIVIGTHGTSGFEEFFLGSNTYKVITETNIPVLSVQTNIKKIGFDKILLPIDNSIPSRQKILHAMTLAKQYGAKIYIAGLLTSEEEDYKKKFVIKINQVEEYLKHHHVHYATEWVYGSNIADMILQQGNKVNADLIVIMTEQEEDFTGLFIGPYAQQIVNHSKIPILSITPEETTINKASY